MKPKVKRNHRGDRVERAAPEMTTIIPPWVFWIATFVMPLTLSAAENSDTSLITSIFAPESTPAHSIMRLSVFVLAITGTIFVVVFSLIVCAVVRFRRRPDDDDDGKEPAQVYG